MKKKDLHFCIFNEENCEEKAQKRFKKKLVTTRATATSCEHFIKTNNTTSTSNNNEIQFSFISIASFTMQIVSRRFTESQGMTPEQISLTKVNDIC